MPAEYILNTQPNLIDFGTLQTDITNFETKFSISGVPFTGPIYDTVPCEDFAWLRSTLDPSGKTDFTYFTGLRVYYGIKSGSIILIYVPVFMDLRGSDTLNNDIFSVTPSSIDYAPTIYIYSGGFTAIDLDTATQYVTNYRNDIMIQRAGGAWTPFISEDSIFGDAKASMITYQEVDLLCNTPPSPFYIVNCATIYPPTGTYKQTISISKVNPTAGTTPLPYVSAANFANMCPPNCAVVEVSKITRRPNDD